MIYDLIIAGSGPSGLSAAIYASRAGLKYAVIEKMFMGIGQISEADKIDNYLGLESINGFDLGMKFRSHAEKCGTEFISDEIVKIEKTDNLFNISLKNSAEKIISKTIIYALGASHRKLGINGESEFTGKGVSYCAVCDGAFYKNKTVVVVGGGDTALSEAVYLSNIAEKVYLMHRRESFRASENLRKKIAEIKNIETILNAVPTEIKGDKKVSSIIFKQDDKTKELSVDGIFVAVGMKPETDIIKNIVDIDEFGYIISDETGRTSLDGFFAAGDARTKSLRQIITAVSDGANCVNSVEKYILTK